MSGVQPIPLCLHPLCRARGVQAVYSGLCVQCSKTVDYILRNPEKYHITKEQLIRDGKMLRYSRTVERAEYGERIDWFLSSDSNNSDPETRLKNAFSRLQELISGMS